MNLKIGNRNLSETLGALFQRRHYVALKNIFTVIPDPWDYLKRYVFARGTYPHPTSVRTPLGVFKPMLYSYYDLLTLNEIFCRHDYGCGDEIMYVLDVGSNIGLSGLYFLTRNDKVRCQFFEPDQTNLVRLKENLAAFGARVTINDCAVADEEGMKRFGVDPASRRYGGLDSDFGEFTEVRCRNINSVLRDAFQQTDMIDVLKIDTEGAEMRTLNAIDDGHLKRIRQIYMEAIPTQPFRPDIFSQTWSGTVCRLVNRTAV